MEQNLREWECRARIGIGALLLTVGWCIDLNPWPSALADGIGSLALFTGAAGACPIWTLLGIGNRRAPATRLHARMTRSTWP